MALEVASSPGMCMDSRNGDVQIYACDGRTHQRWFYDDKGRLRPLSTPNLCLNVDGGSDRNGAKMIMWACGDGNNAKFYRDGKLLMRFKRLALQPVLNVQSGLRQEQRSSGCIAIT
jgi:hypothetical protein